MKPAVFWHFVHYIDSPGDRDWVVLWRGRYMRATRVETAADVATTTVKRPPGRQPRLFIRGRGVVRRRPGGVLEITRA